MFQEDGHKGLLRGLFWAIPFWALVMAANLDLTDGEAYLWTLAKNLDGVHYAHPPLPAWLTAFFLNIFGDGSWSLRLPSLIARTMALGLFVVWSSDRWSRSVAKRGLWILLGSFASIAGAVIALPDAYFCLFAVWTLICADTRKPIGTGVSLGLALLSQVNAIALVPGILWAFTTKRRSGPRWLGLIAALLIAAAMQWPAWRAGMPLYANPQIYAFNIASLFSSVIAILGAQLLLGGITIAGTLVLIMWIIYRGRLSPPILGYNRSESVRVPLNWWILPFALKLVFDVTQGTFRFHHAMFLLFPLCAGLASVLNFSSRDQEARFEWNMLLLSLSTMTVVSITLLYPVGAWLKPFTERFKTYDLRQSPRGDLIGWDTWVQEDLAPAGLAGPEIGYIASDYRLASQAAWTMRLPISQYGAIGKSHQYKYWPTPFTQEFASYVLFADNRRQGLGRLSKHCAHRVDWHMREINLKGHPVKRIYWATCQSLR